MAPMETAAPSTLLQTPQLDTEVLSCREAERQTPKGKDKDGNTTPGQLWMLLALTKGLSYIFLSITYDL